MRLSTQTDVLGRTMGEEEALRVLAKAGFDAADVSFFAMTNGNGPWCADNWRDHAARLRSVAAECGITFGQAHAPFPCKRGEEPFDTVIRQRILRSMEAAALLGVPRIVVHPFHHLPYADEHERLFEENVAFYRSLMPYCESWGIAVCTENMWQRDENRGYIVDSVCAQPQEFAAMIDAVDSPWMQGCLDIGHCALVGRKPEDCIRALGAKHLHALHVHDVDYLHDSHTVPFEARLEWEPITAALAEVGYAGDMTLEADSFLVRLPEQLLPAGSTLMAQVGRYLIERVEYHRAQQA